MARSPLGRCRLPSPTGCYSSKEYPQHVGWGHSAVDDTLRFAALAGVKQLVPFHHDPAHNDDDLDRMITAARTTTRRFTITPGTEGATFEVG